MITQHNAAGVDLTKLNIAGIYHESTGQTLREQDMPLVTKFAEGLAKALAERAVSPAESVPISEHPDVVALRRQDHEQACRVTHALMAERDEWKERADRAEAALNQKRGPDERNEHPNLDVPIDLECSAKLDDLGDDRGQGLDGYWKWGFRAGWHYATKKTEQAILAQPLQQEGGKDSMPVEQEPKYGIRDGRLFNRASGEYIPSDEPVFIFRARDWHAVNILAGYAGEVVDKDHAAAVWKRVDDFKRFWNAHPERMKSPDTATQPSDNLQQASTAQVEPAKKESQ